MNPTFVLIKVLGLAWGDDDDGQTTNDDNNEQELSVVSPAMEPWFRL